MATVTSSPDTTKAVDLLQNLSLDSESMTIAAPEPAKRSGRGPVNEVSKPFNPNANFVPNGQPSTGYYYGGYDGHGDWNAYSSYITGGMTQGIWGDSGSYMYPQGYGYAPYGSYPPPCSSPSVQHDDKFYGLQQYQYPCPYYQSPAFANGSFAANKTNDQDGKISTAAAEHVPSSIVMNKGSTAAVVNGDFMNNNRSKELLPCSQNLSFNSNDSYQRAGYPAYAPVSGYQDPRVGTHGTQPANTSDPLLFSDRHSKHGAKIGSSTSAVPGKDFSSQRNATSPQPLPQFTNYHGSMHSSGLGLVSGFTNGMYPSNMFYSQYGNPYGASSHFGSAAYGSRTGSFDNMRRASSGRRVGDYVKKNVDGFGELNKGPRAANSSDDKNVKSLEPVTLLLKGQNLPSKSDGKEVDPVPNKQQYNGEGLSENYSDAKFYVIKSYSEDDVHKSIKYSVWTSTPNGNKKLDAAYQEAKEKSGDCPVFLLFSVNTSGQFVGLAEMVGPVDFDRTVEYWQQDRWTGCFPLKWHIVKDIPNNVLRHITLENNENKPVTNSRDTQEVKLEKGIQVLKIFKEHSSKTCILDDFEFYEVREKTIKERKSKEQQLPKQVSKSNDLATTGTVVMPKSNDLATTGTVVMPVSHDGTLVNGSAVTDTAGRREKLVEVNGSTPLSPAPEDSERKAA